MNAGVAHHVHQVRARHRGRGGGDKPRQPLDEGVHVVVLAKVPVEEVHLSERCAVERPLRLSGGEHLRDPHGVGGVELFQRLFDQPELVAQRVVRALQIPGGGWQVVGAHGGQRQVAVLLRRPRRLRRDGLEPQHRGAEDALVAKHVLDPRLERAQVFAHHHSTRALRLQH